MIHSLAAKQTVFLIPIGISFEQITHIAIKRDTLIDLLPLYAPRDYLADYFVQLMQDPKVLCVCADAKPLIQLLANRTIQLAKPICLKTLSRLLGDSSQKFPNFTSQIDAARFLFEKMESALSEATTKLISEQITETAKLEQAVLPVFARMEHSGLFFNEVQWKQQLHSYARMSEEIENTLGTHLKQKVNWSDTQQSKRAIEAIIGRQLKDSRAETLSAVEHPSAHLLVHLREIQKILSTWGSHFLDFIDPQSNRIHAHFDPLGTNTGRSSCERPNLQNLPSSPEFQACLEPNNGRIRVRGDYAGAELRILAELSEDENFRAIFHRGEDFHSAVATQIFHVPVSKDCNYALRDKAKVINFGIIYGMGKNTLAEHLSISVQEAESMLLRYFDEFPKVRTFLEQMTVASTKKNWVRSRIGRKIYLDPVLTANERARLAKNGPIQGTGADIIKLAMIYVDAQITAHYPTARLVNMIHDELIIECDGEHRSAIEALLKQEMERAEQAFLPSIPPSVELA